MSDRDAENCRVRDRDVSGTWKGNPDSRLESLEEGGKPNGRWSDRGPRGVSDERGSL